MMIRTRLLPDLQLAVRDSGPGATGRTLVLVHGWPVSGMMWRYQTPMLVERGLRVVAIDLRGFGDSSKPADGYSYDLWSRDIGRVLDVMELDDVTLGGFSMGGAIVMHHVASGSPRVARLALIAAAGPALQMRDDNPDGVPRKTYDELITGLRQDRAMAVGEFGKLVFHTTPEPELAQAMETMAGEAALPAMIAGVGELRDQDLRPMLGRIAVPTRIFHGVHDQVAPFKLTAEVQQRLIPGANLVRFEDSGHGLFWDERAKLTEELARFAL